MGFVIMRRDSLLASRGNSHSLALDLLAQYEYMQPPASGASPRPPMWWPPCAWHWTNTWPKVASRHA
jgi:hypothetical protein